MTEEERAREIAEHPPGWFPIARAKPRYRYMAACKPALVGHWIVVGPGSVRDGVFHDHLGAWPSIEMVFHLPPVEAALRDLDAADIARAGGKGE